MPIPSSGESQGLRELARKLSQLDRRVRSIGSTGQLAHSSIEDGAVQAYNRSGQQVMLIGKQWDGTYAPSVTNGPVPPTPSTPIVTDGTEGISVRWDGGFAGGLLGAPMDYLRVDIHISTTNDFTPDFSNRFGTIVPPTGGEIAFALAPGTYYVKLVCWSQAGVPSAASLQAEADAWPVTAGTDGFPPSSSPAAELVGGYEALSVRWTPITNADPVRYNIYVGTSAGFTKDSTTLVGTSTGSQFTVRLLPGDPPIDPNDPDLRKLQYDTDYYVSVQAEDDDGAATPGAEDVAQIFKIEGAAIGYQTIVGDNILGNTIGADKLSATLVLATEIWAGSASTGQRIGLTPNGMQGYRSDGSLMLNFPTDPTQSTLIDSDVIARSLTAVGAMVMRSNNNAIEKDAVLKLRNGIASPIASPQMSISYFEYEFGTSTLTDEQKTGPLGTFDFKASEVSCIEYKATGSDYWVIHQVRPGGTRAWFFDYDGTPLQIGIEWFHDYVDWEIWSVIEITTSSAPKNGVYRMARWIPSGATNQYYLWSPAGLNKYSRQNGIAPPVIGTNGTDVYVAEVVSNQLNIRYFVPDGLGGNVTPTVAYQSSTGFTSARPLANVLYDAAGFDIGSPRYLVSERGFATDNKLVYTSGTNANSIFLGGSGNSWVSSTINAETFETSHNAPRGTAWDGFNFWTLGGDGVMRQYSETYWDPSVTSSTIWMEHTFRDTDSAGTGTHETTPGPAKSITWKRRSKIRVFMPPIPGSGGVDEPNAITVYAGRGSTLPANTGFHLQFIGNVPSNSFDDFDFTDPNPPTVNSFPNTNPAKIQSDDGNMVISGDGTIKFGTKEVGAELTRLASGMAMHTRTVAGSANFVKPTNPAARFHCVRVWGPAGAGGGVVGAASGTSEGAGGGGGGFVEKWYLDSDLLATEPYMVGAGGAGVSGAAGNAGSAATTFKGLTAGPGGGGAAMTSNTTSQAALRGIGGSASGGDLNIPGGDGGNGRTINGVAVFANHGGAAGGGGSITQQTDFTAGVGTAGVSPGGGGTGAFGSGPAGTNFAGGAGAAGKILIISYF
jgi:hypothetical protein